MRTNEIISVRNQFNLTEKNVRSIHYKFTWIKSTLTKSTSDKSTSDKPI